MIETTPQTEAGPAVIAQTETKVYTDGTSVTGPGPLPDLSPEQQSALTVTRVRVTNNLGFGIFLTVDGVEPGRVAIPRGRSVVVPAAFWEAHRALYDKASFSDLITAVPVD